MLGTGEQPINFDYKIIIEYQKLGFQFEIATTVSSTRSANCREVLYAVVMNIIANNSEKKRYLKLTFELIKIAITSPMYPTADRVRSKDKSITENFFLAPVL